MLPIVDLDAPGAVQALLEACGPDGPGFFHLRMPPSHEVAASAALETGKDFFAADEKWRFPMVPFRYHGVTIPATGAGYRRANNDGAFRLDARESFNTCRGHEWPGAHAFRDVCDTYLSLLEEVGARLCSLMERALDRPKGQLAALANGDISAGTSPHTSLLGFVHYFATKSDVANRRYGIRPHQDSDLFTLLVTDGSPGLEYKPGWLGSALNRDERMLDEEGWVPVEPLPGHYIVNLGTAIRHWGGGRLRATLHRVVNRTGADRFSMPFFFESRLDAVLGPPGSEAPVTYGQVLLQQMERDETERREQAAGSSNGAGATTSRL